MMLSSIPDLVRAQPEALLALAKSYYRVGERAKAADTLSKLAEGRESTAGALLGARLADEMQDYELRKGSFLPCPVTLQILKRRGTAFCRHKVS